MFTNIIGCLSNSAVKEKHTQEETGLVAAEALVFGRSRTTMTRLVTLAILVHVRGRVTLVDQHAMTPGVLLPVSVTAEAGGGLVSRAAQT